MKVPVTHLIVGPPEHGVTRFATDLVAAMRDNGFDARTEPLDGGVHLQFTDRLFGGTPEQAADAVRTMVADTRGRGARLTVTLHDLPQPSDGTNFARRRAAYADIARLVDGVVVSSDHERALLAEAGLHPRDLAVVPLPIEAGDPGPVARGPHPPTVGIFGFVYPGKGHAEVIAALTDAAPDVEVLALGAPSAGHADLVDELTAECARSARRFRITGHLADEEVPRALRAVTVPVAPHRHVSASGSLNSWIGAGRRPLAPANRYTREIAARSPGVVLLYPDTPDGLRDALGAALDDPSTTWLPAGTTCAPSRGDAARQYARLLQRWHR